MTLKRLLFATIILLLAFSLVACGNSGDEITLHVLNWEDYIEPDLIAQFEDENPGIKVKYSSLPNNEEMYTMLIQEDSRYDICFPSDYMIERLIKDDLLHELNYDNIPNFQNVMESSRDHSFDPGNKYSVPYMWGTLGILYNTEMVSEPVTSWNILWDEKYANTILMYDSVRDSMAVSLKRLGYSVNTRDEAELEEATQELIAQKPLVEAYMGDNVKDKMIGDGAALAVVYSGDAVWCMQENEKLEYVVPDEGSNLWFDNMVVLKKSPNKEAAELFINFLCDAAVSQVNSEYIGYTTAIQPAYDAMPAEYLENSAYVADADIIERCEVFHDLGDDTALYDTLWMRVKAE
ncbi:MAG: ABC transporter substrate-binding protein [Christensenellales bacterium]|jgi:spermidine/putrescine-binding protein